MQNRYLIKQINGRSLYWLGTGTGTLIKRGRAKVLLWAQTFTLREKIPSCKCFPLVSKMTTHTYNVLILHLFTILIFDFEIVKKVWYFLWWSFYSFTKQARKNSPMDRSFLPISKTRTNKFYIFRQRM
jgi:hypothetical protein